jgi:hypothetical protein
MLVVGYIWLSLDVAQLNSISAIKLNQHNSSTKHVEMFSPGDQMVLRAAITPARSFKQLAPWVAEKTYTTLLTIGRLNT